MILTDDKDFVDWARPMIYMGRDKNVKYEDDIFVVGGYNMYMPPETAILGLYQFAELSKENKDTADNNHYKDISNLNWND
jgi:dTDP-4-amino-4,6-dideoxygalactose transaminase